MISRWLPFSRTATIATSSIGVTETIPLSVPLGGHPVARGHRGLPAGGFAEQCLGGTSGDRPGHLAGTGVRAGQSLAQKLLEIMHALIEHARGRYGVAPTLMRGPADMLAALRGPTQFCLDFLDTPELVGPALDECARIWETIAQAQLALIPHSAAGYLAGDAALRVSAPDKVLWLQEDAMSLLSPPLYRDYILPVDDRLSNMFPCVAFHLHGSALWAIDDLVKLSGVDVIELNLEAANCDVEGTFAGWKQIQVHKPVIMWRMFGEDFDAWFARVRREFSATGLSVQVSVKDQTEARRVKDTISTWA